MKKLLFVMIIFAASIALADNSSLESGIKYYTVDANYTEALKSFMTAAADDDPVAAYYIGHMYHYGNGVIMDSEIAKDWYAKSANMGYVPAQYNLAVIYDAEPGSTLSAIEWYERAAEGGSDRAAYNLGVTYDQGDGVNQDYAKAAMWYEKAALMGHKTAQKNLGIIYYYGRAGEADIVKGCAWIYLSESSDAVNVCDNSLNAAQAVRALHTMDKLAVRLVQ